MKAIVLILVCISWFANAAEPNTSAQTSIDQLADQEIAKCQAVLNLKAIIKYAFQPEYGFFTIEQIKAKLPPDKVDEYLETLTEVRPYTDSLRESGEVIEMHNPDPVTSECAAFAKGMILSAQLNVIGQSLRREK